MLLSLGFGTQFSTVETVITVLLDRFPNLRGKNRRWEKIPGISSWLFPGGAHSASVSSCSSVVWAWWQTVASTSCSWSTTTRPPTRRSSLDASRFPSWRGSTAWTSSWRIFGLCSASIPTPGSSGSGRGRYLLPSLSLWVISFNPNPRWSFIWSNLHQLHSFNALPWNMILSWSWTSRSRITRATSTTTTTTPTGQTLLGGA